MLDEVEYGSGAGFCVGGGVGEVVPGGGGCGLYGGEPAGAGGWIVVLLGDAECVF